MIIPNRMTTNHIIISMLLLVFDVWWHPDRIQRGMGQFIAELPYEIPLSTVTCDAMISAKET